MSFQLTIDGDTGRAVSRFKNLQTAVSDLSETWNDCADLFVSMASQRFVEQPWPALSPIYLARKLRDGDDLRELVRTGAGLKSLTSSLDVREIRPQSLTVGSKSEPLKINAKGSYDPATGRRLPRRRAVQVGIWRRRVRSRVRRRLVAAAKAESGTTPRRRRK